LERIGVVSGGITGCVVGLFSGYLERDLMIGAIVAALVALLFFKNEILATDGPFEGHTSKIIMSNSWVFWLGNFLASVITAAVEKLDYFWGGFLSCGLSIIIAMIVTAIAAGIVSKGKFYN